MKLDRRELKQRAENALARANCNAKKLLLIHVGTVILVSLLLTVVNYLIQMQIDSTGGLGGIATRSILSTVQSVLNLFQMALMPFWGAGYLTVAIALYRGDRVNTDALLSGFHRFGPLLRLYLLQALVFGGILIGSSYLGHFLYMMTPWGTQLMLKLAASMEQTGSAVLDDATRESMLSLSIPMMLVGAVIFLIAAAPTFYRLRMSQYRIMDGQSSAMRAMAESARMMRGSRISLLKLDLSFWWFYLLQVLISVVGYADVILEYAGIPLPWNAAVSFFFPYLLYLALQLIFLLWQKNRVSVTYAAAYETLLHPQEPQPEIKPDPQKLPWDETHS